MTTTDPTHYAWHPSYGADDEQAAARDHERRQKAQAAIEWTLDNNPALRRAVDALPDLSSYADFWEGMEAVYLAGLTDAEERIEILEGQLRTERSINRNRTHVLKEGK